MNGGGTCGGGGFSTVQCACTRAHLPLRTFLPASFASQRGGRRGGTLLFQYKISRRERDARPPSRPASCRLILLRFSSPAQSVSRTFPPGESTDLFKRRSRRDPLLPPGKSRSILGAFRFSFQFPLCLHLVLTYFFIYVLNNSYGARRFPYLTKFTAR